MLKSEAAPRNGSLHILAIRNVWHLAHSSQRRSDAGARFELLALVMLSRCGTGRRHGGVQRVPGERGNEPARMRRA